MMSVQVTEQMLRLLLAAALGMTIGLEREWREKAAGFRTLALVSLGSAAFSMVAETLAADAGGRVAAGIVTGIGFLGAGAILRDRGAVVGLTTAAAVWMAAALGVAAAAGAYVVAGFGLALALVVLLLFPAVNLAPLTRDLRTYEIAYRSREWDEHALSQPLRDAGLSVSVARIDRSDDGLTVLWHATGRPARHQEAICQLSADETVASMTVI